MKTGYLGLGVGVALLCAPELVAAQPADPEPAGETTDDAAAPEPVAPEPVELEADPAPKPEPAEKPSAKVGAKAAATPVAKVEAEPSDKPWTPRSSFSFGSYGRVVVASDGRGGSGRDADFVAHGSRIDEGTYAELELRRDDEWSPGIESRIVTTLALSGPLFHYDGQFDAKLALRNLYVEERGIIDRGLSAWVGSRMYRGDDIYLLDFWPLDNLNTVGGGVRFDANQDRSFVTWHVGLNRIDDPEFQYQVVQRPAPQNQPGTASVEILDRPRVISSLKLGHVQPLDDKMGVKGVLYGEVHRLPSGTREDQPGQVESLPGDSGYLAGAQLGFFTGERDGFVNLFFKYARGLAAYGDFGTPLGVAPNGTTDGAHEVLLGLSGNYEYEFLGVVAGAYFRSFRDESPEALRFQNVDEGIAVLRPHVFIGQHGGVAVEGSFQKQQRGVLNIATNEPLEPSALRFGLMPYLSPSGRGVFKRPQLRLIWAITRRNDDARALYADDDVFARRRTEQFLGISAEWWFNSSSYGK